MAASSALRALTPPDRPSIADQVFETLQAGILSLELPPGAKLSEIDVASQMEVSRQPVRDAFYRLSKLGFLVIRPQRSTTVSLISESAVLRARYIRTAIEVENMRTAAARLTEVDHAALADMLVAQEQAHAAQDKRLFHRLDDEFHHEICRRSQVGFAWDLITENKAHMDRVRMLSLSFASPQVIKDHRDIFDHLVRRDGAAAADAMRVHLSRIVDLIERLRSEKHAWFESEPSS
ncbi:MULTISPECIES: GntR family transcriptional regulator [unclassified Yoonia]|uniref:GntR family transcriptional regulator n=1 Tax=unclassified Yoonia TaxID=2629118 RepID=UPI002AFF4FFA|nr:MULTISPECIES: GntR family transcriptional regulator [unclassified Yoonia]